MNCYSERSEAESKNLSMLSSVLLSENVGAFERFLTTFGMTH
jgi:hypothetical protein